MPLLPAATSLVPSAEEAIADQDPLVEDDHEPPELDERKMPLPPAAANLVPSAEEATEDQFALCALVGDHEPLELVHV